MKEVIKTFVNGPYTCLFWFFILIVMVYIPCMYIRIRNKKEKTDAYVHEHPDAVKVYIDRTELSDLLTVWRVNGKKPVLFSEKLKYGVYLLPGENRVDVTYQWFEIDVISPLGYKTHTAANKTLTVTAETNRTYSLYYDHTLKEYVFAIKQF